MEHPAACGAAQSGAAPTGGLQIKERPLHRHGRRMDQPGRRNVKIELLLMGRTGLPRFELHHENRTVVFLDEAIDRAAHDRGEAGRCGGERELENTRGSGQRRNDIRAIARPQPQRDRSLEERFNVAGRSPLLLAQETAAPLQGRGWLCARLRVFEKPVYEYAEQTIG